MTSTKLVASLHLRRLLPSEAYYEPLFSEVLKELCSLSKKIEFDLDEFGVCYPTIKLSQRSISRRRLQIGVLRISIEVSLPDDNSGWAAGTEPMTLEEVHEFAISQIDILFKK